MWTLDLLRDAMMELTLAQKRKQITEAQKEYLVVKRNKCFVRTEELGLDEVPDTF